MQIGAAWYEFEISVILFKVTLCITFCFCPGDFIKLRSVKHGLKSCNTLLTVDVGFLRLWVNVTFWKLGTGVFSTVVIQYVHINVF